ncbi:hypothetical protein GCM10010924_51850 [Rhizobium wenxiniae]|uniref:PAS domain-containing protein n=2 Tax=Rhizobium wenxiniae TaxID=1737357 RepID=A0A7X0D3Q4_9HYPH|nr:PAS domain-containing protein [Rhizobium wenxiniae]MBB6165716.1 PAS domain-containing protein [Rhizobium wenxiniae]GGG16465.1 hypothetical protein GCM10010924_51850 [Rhizobium wenxiniae]
MVAVVGVNAQGARDWTDTKVGIVEDVAESARSAVERARAEDALRESEERYRTLFEAIDEGFAIFEMIYNASGQTVDFRYVETNPAFERQTGRRPQPGQTMRETGWRPLRECRVFYRGLMSMIE